MIRSSARWSSRVRRELALRLHNARSGSCLSAGGILTERVEGERDRLLGCQLPALLPRLGKRGFVELRANGRERLLVRPLHPILAEAELIEQRLPTREHAGSRSRHSLGGDGAGEAANDEGQAIGVVELAVDAKGVAQQPDGVIHPSVTHSVSRKLFERRRLDVLVPQRPASAEVVLEQLLGAIRFAELAVRPREEASRLQRVVLVPEVAEESNALLEEPPRLQRVALDRGNPDQEQRLGAAPGISKGTVQRNRLLGPHPPGRRISGP